MARAFVGVVCPAHRMLRALLFQKHRGTRKREPEVACGIGEAEALVEYARHHVRESQDHEILPVQRVRANSLYSARQGHDAHRVPEMQNRGHEEVVRRYRGELNRMSLWPVVFPAPSRNRAGCLESYLRHAPIAPMVLVTPMYASWRWMDFVCSRTSCVA